MNYKGTDKHLRDVIFELMARDFKNLDEVTLEQNELWQTELFLNSFALDTYVCEYLVKLKTSMEYIYEDIRVNWSISGDEVAGRVYTIWASR